MTLAGKAYFDAVSKVGENAMVSPVSRELGEFHASPGSFYLQRVKSQGGLPDITFHPVSVVKLELEKDNDSSPSLLLKCT